MINLIALISSSILIQLINCFPDPRIPPAPNKNGGNIFFKAPPSLLKTIPVLILTVLIPASSADLVEFSHSTQTSGKNPLPDSEFSSKSSSFLSP